MTTTTEAKDRLTAAVRELAASDNFEAWLRTSSAFRRYSLNNRILIAIQKPEATHVAGYKAWLKLGRQVQKGEHGIRILAPMVGRPRDAEVDDEGRRLFGFRCVSVFDVTQTEGEPLPELGHAIVTGDGPEGVFEHLAGLAEANGLRIETGPSEQGEHGYLRRSDNLIHLTEGLEGAGQVAVLAHELAHFFDPELAATPGIYGHERGDCEAVAEAAAFTVCLLLGLEIESQAATYIAAWVRGDSERLLALGRRIDAAVSAILPDEVAA